MYGHDPVLNRQGAFLRTYMDVSRLNHSCYPNAILSFYDDGNVDVIAIRDMIQGETVEINYISRLWRASTTARRAVLLRNWGFTCACPHCVAGPLPLGHTIKTQARLKRTRLAMIMPHTTTLHTNFNAMAESQRAKGIGEASECVTLIEDLIGKRYEWLDA